ncbi:hypothetical protein AUEXF2481DRAFT_552157 [Aureobasidium subglaciale EXF-2481]|uniref:Uncharacterized protein n=1 Tax=Aureobasidium subglaciale (strain EXF-2481) TaxID=1043005 RepID=A0A074YJJ5_AURSE|nr:uncharacterized protein AUEXF2481DRAFT_552157 [Aureobasidium subglaciale EXF-2481]KEQ97870.1 hypothetical protein AUEXF2481DRAFT_552157 [Aureobasidium subglaciale EXF-2481]
MSRRDQSWPVWLLLELSTDQSLFSQGCSECSFYALRYSVSRSCAERFRGEGSGDRRIAKDGIEVCSVSVERDVVIGAVVSMCMLSRGGHGGRCREEENRKDHVSTCGIDSFFESRDGRRWGL